MKFRKPPAIPENSRLKSIASGTAEVFKLDPRLISRDPGFNKRYDFGDIQILAEDILENGVLEALKVRKEGTTVFLVNGDRRLSAIQLLIRENLWPQDPKNPGFPMPVPCTSEGTGVKPLDRIFMMLSLNTGKPFTLLEKGLAYQDILALDSSICASEIARRSGETKQAVSNAITLASTASPELLHHVTSGNMAATTALEICKSHPTHAAQDAAASKAITAAHTNGHSRITPKDLPKKQPQPTTTNPSDPSDLSDPSNPSDPSDAPEPFIADLSNEPAPDPHAPADPSAYDRLKNATPSHRDGSSSSGPGASSGSGYATPDKRVKNIENLLDEIDESQCVPSRFATVELILDYLNGNHTITTIRDHLIKK